MSGGNYLAAVRQIEEHFHQQTHKEIENNITGLIAILTRRDNKTKLPVFLKEKPIGILGFDRAVSLEQLLKEKQDLSESYDGMVITFETLSLLRPDIVTRGSHFYAIEILYQKLGLRNKLPETQLE